ncbi:MAG TPA: GHKL domain-containing protein [Aquificae bacterium]|nr:GHKL domain-containing protein [Aquificota bacterium]
MKLFVYFITIFIIGFITGFIVTFLTYKRKIKFYVKKFKEVLKKLGEEYKKLQLAIFKALEYIKEGFILLDKRNNLIYANQEARKLLDIPENYKGKPAYEVINNFDILCALNRHNEQQNEKIYEINNRKFLITLLNFPQNKCLIFHNLSLEKSLKELKKDFISNISHEFKTPLATLKVILETIKDEYSYDSHLIYFINKSLKQINSMENLVKDILTLAELEDENFEIKKVKFNLKDMIESILSELEVEAISKNIKININVPDIIMNTSDRLIYYALKNLIENAIKYNKKNGLVEINLEDGKDHYILKIKDTGIGIPKYALPFIFERFYRVEKSRSRELGGTGLGLSIVKLAIDKINGNIEVESEKDKGTVFSLYFPKSIFCSKSDS